MEERVKTGIVYNEDCVDTMLFIPHGSIDMVLTSPPYDSMRDYGGTSSWSLEKAREVIGELYDILKEGGVCVWVVGDETVDGSETMTSFRHAMMFVEAGFRLHDTMIYSKDNPCPVGGSNRYYQSFEYMFVFSKGSPKTFNPLTEPRRNKYNDTRTERVKGFQRGVDGNMVPKFTKINQGDPKRRNVWTYSLGSSDHTGHPAVFPYDLAKDHILSWTNDGDIVYDPFMGSGTTAIACIRNNRRFIGSEISTEYFNACKERIREENRIVRLF